MVGLLAPSLIASVAALACGGSLRRLVTHGMRGWPAVVLAFAIELALYNPPLNSQGWSMRVGPWVWLAARMVLLGVLVANGWRAEPASSVWPWRIAAVGVALNTLVVAFNGGHMPQSPEAAVMVWGASHIDPSRLQNVTPLGADTQLPWLGDIFAEPTWLPRPNVVSIGDILLALGIASWVFSRAVTPARPATAKIRSGIAATIDGVERSQRGSSS